MTAEYGFLIHACDGFKSVPTSHRFRRDRLTTHVMDDRSDITMHSTNCRFVMASKEEAMLRLSLLPRAAVHC